MAQIKYRIANIKEKFFSIQEDHNLIASTIRSETTYAIDVSTHFDPDAGLISISFDFKLVPRQNRETMLVHYAANMNYEIIGYDLSTENSESITLPAEIMSSVVGATYSTFRGIIYSRCGNSILRESIVPLINPSFFLDKASAIDETAKNNTLSKSEG
jgi:hypothetical protein